MSQENILRQLRLTNEYSVYELAELANVHPTLIYRMETQALISDESLMKIAEALKIRPDIIYYNMGKFPKDKIDFVKKDPLSFMKAIDGLCTHSYKLKLTSDFIEDLKNVENKIVRAQKTKLLYSKFEEILGDTP